MNTLFKMAGFALLCALCTLLLKAQHREAGRLCALCGGLMLLCAVVTQLEEVVLSLRRLSQQAGLQSGTLSLLVRMMAMAYVTEFAAQTCRDAGEEGLAGKAALAGKIVLTAQTLPLITRIGTIALSFLP